MSAGSNAGRGFRYQDAVLTFLSFECWQTNLGSIIPEGNDDAEIHIKNEIHYIQVKSRRERLGLYKQNEVRSYIREMWKRADSQENLPRQLVLILETGIQNDIERCNLDKFSLQACEVISDKLRDDAEAKVWMDHTFIRIVSNPAYSSNILMEGRLSWENLHRSILFASIQNYIGDASNKNGDRIGSARISLSSNEVESEIKRLKGALNPNNLPEAIRKGMCSPLDFVTPLEEPEFYSGVNVKPGHLAAGLVVSRPHECNESIATIERTKRAVVAAPSGSGKSALMWQIAQSCKHSIRWFEIHTRSEFDIGSVRRLIELLEPTIDAPVGFVMDDIGQTGTKIWKQLSQLIGSCNGSYLLGSIREEDLALLDTDSRSSVMRYPIHDELPERIWNELKKQGKTECKGWREVWNASNGLLLEYTHLLTQGKRLAETLKDQVSRRLREKRDDELLLIRVISVVAQTGATVDIEKLLKASSCTADELRRILSRLENEHVIRVVDHGRALIALHQLRSKFLTIYSHDDLTHPLEATLAIGTKIVSANGLEAFIAYHADQHIGVISSSFLDRFGRMKSLTELAAFLDGIDRAAMWKNATEWVEKLIHESIPKTQAGSIALFALAGQDFPKIFPNKFASLYEDLQTRFQHDERYSYLIQATDDLLVAIRMCTDVTELSQFLSSVHGCQLPPSIQDALVEWGFDFLNAPIDDVITVLEPCTETCRPVAIEWAKRAGTQELANRLLEQVPQATLPRFYEEEGMQIVESNFILDPAQEADLDDANKQILDYLQFLAPTAERVDTRVVTVEGSPFQVGHYELHRKAIKRERLVGSPKPRRIRRWNTEIGYVLSPMGITEYLSKGRRIFDEIYPLTGQLIDVIINKRKRKVVTIRSLEALQDRAADLVRPPQGDDGAIGVSKLQSVSYFMTNGLFLRLAKLPDQSMALHSYLHSQIDDIEEFLSEEPWEMLPQGAPRHSADVKELFAKLMNIIDYCDVAKIDFGVAINRLRLHSGKVSLQKLAETAKTKVDVECKKIMDRIVKTVTESGIECEVIFGTREGKFGRRDFPVLILTETDLELGPIGSAGIVAKSVREQFPSRSFTIIPSHEGKLLSSMGIRGVDTWFPITEGLDEWKGVIEPKYFSSPLLDAFEMLTQAAFTISNGELYTVHNSNDDEFSTPMSKFIQLLPAKGTKNFEHSDFEEFFELLCTSGEFARDLYDEFKCDEPSELLQILTVMRNDVAIQAILEK